MHRVFLAAASAAALLAAGLGDAAAQQTPLSRPPLPGFQDPPRRPRRRGRAVRRRRRCGESCGGSRRRPAAPAAPPRHRSWRRRWRAPPLAATSTRRSGSMPGRGRILGQREAMRSREAQVRSPIAGSPAIGCSFRSDTRGPRTGNEWDVELGAPMWLPGQRGALAGTVTRRHRGAGTPPGRCAGWNSPGCCATPIGRSAWRRRSWAWRATGWPPRATSAATCSAGWSWATSPRPRRC